MDIVATETHVGSQFGRENEHETPAGSVPGHENVTDSAVPETSVAVAVVPEGLPCTTEEDVGSSESEKSNGGGVGVTVSVSESLSPVSAKSESPFLSMHAKYV